MDIKTRARANYDRTDLDFLEETCRQRGWEMIRERLEQMLEAERSTCEQTDSTRAAVRSQGAVRALRTALRIPEILALEIRTRHKIAS
jgi:hypothetical protein